MNQQLIAVYIRKTNGKGQKVLLNASLRVDTLSQHIKNLFKFENQQISLFFQGKEIDSHCKDEVSEMGIQNDSIIYIRQKAIMQHMEPIFIKIFCNGNLYSYESKPHEKVQQLRKQFKEKFGQQKNFVFSFMGRNLQNSQTFQDIGLKNNDNLSALMFQDQTSQINLKPFCKRLQSITIATTQNTKKQEIKIKAKAKQIMRKSSMKSSQESREKQTPLQIMEETRAKSESSFYQNLQKNKDQLDSDNNDNFFFVNYNYIQTKSISCDQSFEEDPKFWNQCTINFMDNSQTQYFAIQCLQGHKWQNVLNKLAITLKVHPFFIDFYFEDPQFENSLLQNKNILDLAKNRSEKQLPIISFSIIPQQ